MITYCIFAYQGKSCLHDDMKNSFTKFYFKCQKYFQCCYESPLVGVCCLFSLLRLPSCLPKAGEESCSAGLGTSPPGSLSACAEQAWARRRGAAGHDTTAAGALWSPEWYKPWWMVGAAPAGTSTETDRKQRHVSSNTLAWNWRETTSLSFQHQSCQDRVQLGFNLKLGLR